MNSRVWTSISGLLVLAVSWLGLPWFVRDSFWVHMTMHMAVVAIGAPLLAFAASGTRLDLTGRFSSLMNPIALSLLELAVVWGWHAPLFHEFARTNPAGLVLEQASFFLTAWLLWMSPLGGLQMVQGILGLLLTSMHMTLLGALLALASRPLYDLAYMPICGTTQAHDQQIGGAIMLVAGAVSYLAGGLYLTVRLLRQRSLPEGLKA